MNHAIPPQIFLAHVHREPDLLHRGGKHLRRNRFAVFLTREIQRPSLPPRDLRPISKSKHATLVQYGERERPAAFRLAPFAEAQVAHAPRTAPSRCPKVSCFDLVALALTARAEGRAGTLALLRRIVERLAGARWYVFAVGYMAAIKLAVALLHRLATGAWPPFGQAALYIMVVAIVLSTPVQAGEEIGWRGYALPRLARHLGELR